MLVVSLLLLLLEWRSAVLPLGDGGQVGLWIDGTVIWLVETDELVAQRVSVLLVRAWLLSGYSRLVSDRRRARATVGVITTFNESLQAGCTNFDRRERGTEKWSRLRRTVCCYRLMTDLIVGGIPEWKTLWLGSLGLFSYCRNCSYLLEAVNKLNPN